MTENGPSRPQAREQLVALGQMSGEIIHDLANELTVLHGWALVARGEQEAGRAASAEIERVLEISSHLGAMMRDMLETLSGQISSPEAVFDPLRITEATLGQRVRDLSGITVRLQTSLPPGCQVGGRATFWSRSLLNLLSNAGRYARREIVVSLSERSNGHGSLVVLRVEDDGPGIPEERRDQIFQALWRGDDGELGLGLSSVSWAVEQLHGEVEYLADSHLGGAAFEVRVPTASHARPDRPDQHARRPDLTGMRIAVLEHEPEQRRSVARVLRRDGAEVLELLPEDDVEDRLLTRIDGVLPDMILLDVKGVRRGGRSIWNEIYREFPHLKERVVFTGADVDAEVGRQISRHTGQPFLCKPFNHHELASLARGFRTAT